MSCGQKYIMYEKNMKYELYAEIWNMRKKYELFAEMWCMKYILCAELWFTK